MRRGSNRVVLGAVLVGLWLPFAACEVGEGGEGGEGGTGGGGGGACSTGRFVNVEEGPTMKPGGDCISCHSSGEGPHFTVAGTVMNDYVDAIGCEGIEGVTVTLTDADGGVHTLHTNATGNFYTSEPIPVPYTAELSYMGDTRSMGSAQTDTNCMSCHTDQGAAGAPGRILAP